LIFACGGEAATLKFYKTLKIHLHLIAARLQVLLRHSGADAASYPELVE
jgi:hypothetical protein